MSRTSTNEQRATRCERIANAAALIGAAGVVMLVAHILGHIFSLGYPPVLAPLGTVLLLAFVVSSAADHLADHYRDADDVATE